MTNFLIYWSWASLKSCGSRGANRERHKFGANMREEVSFRVHVGRERVNESDWSRGVERSVQDSQIVTIHT